MQPHDQHASTLKQHSTALSIRYTNEGEAGAACNSELSNTHTKSSSVSSSVLYAPPVRWKQGLVLQLWAGLNRLNRPGEAGNAWLDQIQCCALTPHMHQRGQTQAD